MANRAVLFAIDSLDEQNLLNAHGDEAVMREIEAIEERWDKEWLCELDKAWDAIHRALTDGKLEWTNGEYPLNHAIIGGRQLYEGEDYVVTFVEASQVKDLAVALKVVDATTLKQGYDLINPDDYQFAGWDDDYEYTVGWFDHLAPFYVKAAEASRSVVFTVDL